jgi:hypothetical protein
LTAPGSGLKLRAVLGVVVAISLFWVVASCLYLDHWWEGRKERQLRARMQASLDALDARED